MKEVVVTGQFKNPAALEQNIKLQNAVQGSLRGFLGGLKHVFNRVNNRPLEQEQAGVWLRGATTFTKPWAPSTPSMAAKRKEKKRKKLCVLHAIVLVISEYNT